MGDLHWRCDTHNGESRDSDFWRFPARSRYQTSSLSLMKRNYVFFSSSSTSRYLSPMLPAPCRKFISHSHRIGPPENRGCSRDPNYLTVARHIDVDVEKKNDQKRGRESETRNALARVGIESLFFLWLARFCVSIIAPDLIYTVPLAFRKREDYFFRSAKIFRRGKFSQYREFETVGTSYERVA